MARSSKERLTVVEGGDGNASESPPLNGRSFPAVFPWYDEYFLSTQNIDRLQLVARAAILIEDLVATANEISPADSAWVSYGIGQALRVLANGPESSAIGVLLCSLEAITPPEHRARWPLSDAIDHS